MSLYDNVFASTANAVGPARSAYEALCLQLLRSHVFEVPRGVGILLSHTDNEPHPIRLPFPRVFIEMHFVVAKGDRQDSFNGLLLTEAQGEFFPHGRSIISAFAFKERFEALGGNGLGIWSTYCDTGEPVESGPAPNSSPIEGLFPQGRPLDKTNRAMTEQARRDLNRILLNFNDLLETKDVRLAHLDAENLNRKRQRDGSPLLIAKTRVVLRNELRQYIASMEAKGAFELSHAFWVRGHWRHFRNELYGDRVGQRSWVKPYVKNIGKGILVKKSYVVEPSLAKPEHSSTDQQFG